MPYRVQLKQDIYMPLEGQWQMVLSGSVIDVPDRVTFTAAQATTLGESGVALHNSTLIRQVRNVRKPKG